MAIDPTIFARAYSNAAGPPLDPVAIRRQQIVDEQAASEREYRAAQIENERAQMAAAERKQATLGQVGSMAAAGDVEGARRTALSAGQFDIIDKLDGMDDAQRKRTLDVTRSVAPVIASLKNVPPAMRRQAAAAVLPSRGLSPQQIEALDLSDAGIDAKIGEAMTITEYLAKQKDDRNFGLETQKFGNTVAQQNIDNQFQAANLGVAQQNLGLRAAEVRNNAAGGMTPRQAQQTQLQLRKEFDGLPEVKAFKEIAPVIMSARRAPDNAAGDIQLAYTVGKILDPNSVVREGELAMAVKAGSPLERLLGSGTYTLGQGGRMTPQIRKELLGMLNERALANRQAYDAARNNYKGYAAEVGLNPQSIVGTHVADAYASKTPPKPATVAGGKLTAPKNGVRDWKP
jgi:hypothetical protein